MKATPDMESQWSNQKCRKELKEIPAQYLNNVTQILASSLDWMRLGKLRQKTGVRNFKENIKH